MFLMFHLERPDVLPTGDLGIRRAMLTTVHGYTGDRRWSRSAEPWRPYRTLCLPVSVRSLYNDRTCLRSSRQATHDCDCGRPRRPSPRPAFRAREEPRHDRARTRQTAPSVPPEAGRPNTTPLPPRTGSNSSVLRAAPCSLWSPPMNTRSSGADREAETSCERATCQRRSAPQGGRRGAGAPHHPARGPLVCPSRRAARRAVCRTGLAMRCSPSPRRARPAARVPRHPP
jgi:hypothetical protein